MDKQRRFMMVLWLLPLIFPLFVSLWAWIIWEYPMPITQPIHSLADGVRPTIGILALGWPFLSLALDARKKLKEHQFELIFPGLRGALIAVLISSFSVWGVVLFRISHDRDVVGANIGAAMLFGL